MNLVINLLSRSLTKSDRRVRMPKAMESQILEFAGVDKMDNALPVLEQIIMLEEAIASKLTSGATFHEIDGTGEEFLVKFVLGDADLDDSKGGTRVRLTDEIHNYIIERSGKNSFSEALPYLQSAINMAILIRGEADKGSKFFIKDSNGAMLPVAICS